MVFNIGALEIPPNKFPPVNPPLVNSFFGFWITGKCHYIHFTLDQNVAFASKTGHWKNFWQWKQHFWKKPVKNATSKALRMQPKSLKTTCPKDHFC